MPASTPMGQQDSRQGLVKRQIGHRARLALDPAQVAVLDAQGHAARTTWNLLHDWWTMLPKAKRTLAAADAVIRQGRSELDWLGVLPAQAAQAVLKTYFQAWKKGRNLPDSSGRELQGAGSANRPPTGRSRHSASAVSTSGTRIRAGTASRGCHAASSVEPLTSKRSSPPAIRPS